MYDKAYYYIKGKKIPEKDILDVLGKYICPNCFSPTIHDGTHGETYCTNNDCNNAMLILGRIKRNNIHKAAVKLIEGE